MLVVKKTISKTHEAKKADSKRLVVKTAGTRAYEVKKAGSKKPVAGNAW